jgi:hypothetical protein
MSTPANDKREDEVLVSFIDFLKGYLPDASIIERPDRPSESAKRYPQVTTDSLISVSSSFSDHFAADVMVLAMSRDNLIYEEITKRLDPICESKGIVINLLAERLLKFGELEDFMTSIELEIQSNSNEGNLTLMGEFHISWHTNQDGELSRFELTAGVLHSHSANLAEQICSENYDPLQKKTKPGGQAERTKESGIPYVLLLDSIGQSEVQQGTHFLASRPATYRQGILMALGDKAVLVDAIFLLQRNGEWATLKNVVSFLGQLSDD